MKTLYKYYLLVLSIMLVAQGFTQSLFNSRYSTAKGPAVIGGINYYNNNYYITGGSRDSTFYIGPPINNMKLTILKVDKYGNELWNKRYGDNSINYNIQFNSTPVFRNSAFYYIGVSRDTLNKAHQYLFKFNEQGDSLLLKYYYPNDTTIQTYGGNCKIARDGKLMLCGVVDSSFYNKFSQMYLMKTDTLGNIIWQQTYGGSAYETCTNMDTCSDGGFILGGWTTSYGGSDQDPYIVKTDSNGNFMWQKVFNYDAFNEWPAVVISTQDGGILAVTTEVQTFISSTTSYNKLFFNKYDINGNLLWRKNIGDTLLNAVIFTVKEAANGDIVAVANGIYYNLLLKLNANGDSLLMEQINWVEGGCSQNQQYEFDLALIDSGGYAVAGFIIPSPSNINNTQDAWLSTYDSLGCQLPNAPFNLTAIVNYSSGDTLINLNWQYNSTNPNELFVIEEYLPQYYGWDIRNDECLNTFPNVGNIATPNTFFNDTLRNKTKAIYRVFAVDTVTHLTSCHSNIAVVDLTVGIAPSLSEKVGVKLYPNPNNGIFNIELKEIGNTTIEIYNLAGQLVLKQNTTKHRTTIKLINQPKGMYFYHITNKENSYLGKIIIQ